MNRRSFLIGLGAAFAAPAIIRIAPIMPVKVVPSYATLEEYFERILKPSMAAVFKAYEDAFIYGTGAYRQNEFTGLISYVSPDWRSQ